MKDTIDKIHEKLIRKNERLKAKLSKIYRCRAITTVSVAACIAVGFVIELCFNQIKDHTKGG